MATTLTLTPKCSVSWDYHNVDATLGDTANTNSLSYSGAMTNGTGASQADLVYVTSGTIAASGSLNIDLAGSVANFFGTTLTFARVKLLYINSTTDTTSSSISVGNGTNPFVNWVGAAAHTVTIRNGGALFLCAPDATAYVVTATTGDVLKILNNDGSNVCTYRVVIGGASA